MICDILPVAMFTHTTILLQDFRDGYNLRSFSFQCDHLSSLLLQAPAHRPEVSRDQLPDLRQANWSLNRSRRGEVETTITFSSDRLEEKGWHLEVLVVFPVPRVIDGFGHFQPAKEEDQLEDEHDWDDQPGVLCQLLLCDDRHQEVHVNCKLHNLESEIGTKENFGKKPPVYTGVARRRDDTNQSFRGQPETLPACLSAPSSQQLQHWLPSPWWLIKCPCGVDHCKPPDHYHRPRNGDVPDSTQVSLPLQ